MNRWGAIAGVTIVAFSVLRCGSGRDDLDLPSLYAVASTTDYPAVVKVISPGGRGLCTGTVVGPKAVLTAAHCVTEPGTYRVATTFGQFTPEGIRVLGDGSLEDVSDLAVLHFSFAIADPSAGQVLPIGRGLYTRAPVRLVGYGCSNIDTRLGSGTKRTGTNQVYALTDYVELLTPLDARVSTRSIVGPDNRAGACFGDSGSPLLFSDGQSLRVVGVGHSGAWNDTELFSYFSDLSRTEHRTFLSDLDRELDLNLLNPCDVPGIRAAYCAPQSAFAGITSFLKLLWAKLLTWIF